MTNDSQSDHINELLRIHRRNLQYLETQIAQYGGEMSAPIHLLSQRYYERAEIERLEGELSSLKRTTGFLKAQATPAALPTGTDEDVTNESDLTRLRKGLIKYFSDGELRDLCFDFGIDYDNLPGQGKADKARELVTYFAHRGRITELRRACARLRPHVMR
jgi:hypothetical protein